MSSIETVLNSLQNPLQVIGSEVQARTTFSENHSWPDPEEQETYDNNTQKMSDFWDTMEGFKDDIQRPGDPEIEG